MYQLLGVIFGSLITALSFNLFLIPNNILSSGIGGVAIIIGILTPFNTGLVNLLLNLPILILDMLSLENDSLVIQLYQFSHFRQRYMLFP